MEDETRCQLIAQSMPNATQQLLQQTLSSDFIALLKPLYCGVNTKLIIQLAAFQLTAFRFLLFANALLSKCLIKR